MLAEETNPNYIEYLERVNKGVEPEARRILDHNRRVEEIGRQIDFDEI